MGSPWRAMQCHAQWLPAPPCAQPLPPQPTCFTTTPGMAAAASTTSRGRRAAPVPRKGARPVAHGARVTMFAGAESAGFGFEGGKGSCRGPPPKGKGGWGCWNMDMEGGAVAGVMLRGKGGECPTQSTLLAPSTKLWRKTQPASHCCGPYAAVLPCRVMSCHVCHAPCCDMLRHAVSCCTINISLHVCFPPLTTPHT